MQVSSGMVILADDDNAGEVSKSNLDQQRRTFVRIKKSQLVLMSAPRRHFVAWSYLASSSQSRTVRWGPVRGTQIDIFHFRFVLHFCLAWAWATSFLMLYDTVVALLFDWRCDDGEYVQYVADLWLSKFEGKMSFAMSVLSRRNVEAQDLGPIYSKSRSTLWHFWDPRAWCPSVFFGARSLLVIPGSFLGNATFFLSHFQSPDNPTQKNPVKTFY
jgi:hypothetical protein